MNVFKTRWNARLTIGIVVCLLMLGGIGSAAAQTDSALVVFVNSAGQVIVTSADASYRWIVTNPGEVLAPGANPVWSPDGASLIFGIQAGGAISVRSADVFAQRVDEIAQVNARLSSLSPDGAHALTLENGGYGLLNVTSGQSAALDLTAEPSGGSPLWNLDSSAPLVAFWGYRTNPTLAVANADTGESIAYETTFSTPIVPLAWGAGSERLVFRDAGGVHVADVGCLASGSCAGDELSAAPVVLPGSVTSVDADDRFTYFADGALIGAAPFGCDGLCTDTAAVIVTDADSGTSFDVADGRLVYTANTQDVRAVDLTCLEGGSCQPRAIASSGLAGALSADGRYAVVGSSGGLNAIDLDSGAITLLSDSAAALNAARWSSS